MHRHALPIPLLRPLREPPPNHRDLLFVTGWGSAFPVNLQMSKYGVPFIYGAGDGIHIVIPQASHPLHSGIFFAARGLSIRLCCLYCFSLCPLGAVVNPGSAIQDPA